LNQDFHFEPRYLDWGAKPKEVGLPTETGLHETVEKLESTKSDKLACLSAAPSPG